MAMRRATSGQLVIADAAETYAALYEPDEEVGDFDETGLKATIWFRTRKEARALFKDVAAMVRERQ